MVYSRFSNIYVTITVSSGAGRSEGTVADKEGSSNPFWHFCARASIIVDMNYFSMRTASIHMFLFGFQNGMQQMRRDMVQLEEQELHDEVHMMQLIDLKKQLLRTQVSGALLFYLHALGSIIDHIGHAVTLSTLLFKRILFFSE